MPRHHVRRLRGGNANIRIDDTVVVFAQGPIGLCATAGARLLRATTIIAVDGNEHRLDMSRRMGADVVLDFRRCDVVDEVMKLTGGRGADSAIEVLGTQQTFEQSPTVLRPGGTLSSLGVYSADLTIPPAAFAAGRGDHRIVIAQCPGGKGRMRLQYHRDRRRPRRTTADDRMAAGPHGRSPMTNEGKTEVSDTLFALLHAHGIDYERCDHPAVFTTAEAERLVPPLPGAKAKNLFLRDTRSGRQWLVVVPYAKRVDLARLAVLLDAKKLSFESADALLDRLGVTPGAVSLLALVNDTEAESGLVIDEALWRAEAIQCHPLVNTATIVLGRDGLRRFLERTGHTPRVLDVPARADPA